MFSIQHTTIKTNDKYGGQFIVFCGYVVKEQSWPTLQKLYTVDINGSSSRQHADVQTMRMESKISIINNTTSLHP